MADVRYKVCDRCGKKIEYSGKWVSLLYGVRKSGSKIKVCKVYSGNLSGYDYLEHSMELCSECTEELSDFLNKPNEEMEK